VVQNSITSCMTDSEGISYGLPMVAIGTSTTGQQAFPIMSNIARLTQVTLPMRRCPQPHRLARSASSGTVWDLCGARTATATS